MGTAQIPLPPARRSRVALRITAAAALGRFELQRCTRCSAVQYPPREACHRCLSDELVWSVQSGSGRLIAQTTLFHSHEPYFRERLPWRLGLIRLDVGPTVVAHIHSSVPAAPATVQVTVRLDEAGQAALIAGLPGEDTAMNEDPRIREMCNDPHGRTVFITDGSTPLGQSLVRELTKAGSKQIWVGEPPGTTCVSAAAAVPFDVRSDRCVAAAALKVGAEVDIFVNNSQYEGSAGDPEEVARQEMEINYFGLLRLSRHFVPPMRARSERNPRAWVNFLSVYALSSLPAQPTFSASMAAALSFSQGLRARSRPARLRVMNVFPAAVPADSLARALTAALTDGLEDVYPGDVAQEWLTRWLQSPKAFERELAG